MSQIHENIISPTFTLTYLCYNVTHTDTEYELYLWANRESKLSHGWSKALGPS